MSFLQRRWHRVCAETIGSSDFWRVAVDHASIKHALDPLISKYARGRILDVGAGRLAWRDLLAARGEYVPADLEARHPDIIEIFDVQKPFPFKDSSFTTLFCCSVLEHVPEPWNVLSEFKRILEPGGCAILSVPLIYHVHGAPHDYWRFTPYGVEKLAEMAGLEVVSIETSGGIAHTIAHLASVISGALLWNSRFRAPTFAITGILTMLARSLDHFDRGAFPQSVNAVLRRPV